MREDQQGLNPVERRIKRPSVLSVELEAKVSLRSVVGEDDLEAAWQLARQAQSPTSGQAGAAFQNPAPKLFAAARPAVGGIERFRDIGRGTKGSQAAVVGLALRLRRARTIDPLHRIEEGSDPGAGAVQGLDDGVLFGACVLVLVADHHWDSGAPTCRR